MDKLDPNPPETDEFDLADLQAEMDAEADRLVQERAEEREARIESETAIAEVMAEASSPEEAVAIYWSSKIAQTATENSGLQDHEDPRYAAFEEELQRLARDRLAGGSFRVSFGIDYAPDEVLGAALDAAGINPRVDMVTPHKTYAFAETDSDGVMTVSFKSGEDLPMIAAYQATMDAEYFDSMPV